MKRRDERLNKSALARALGTSLTTLKKHLARSDAPQPDRAGLFDVRAARRYISGRRLLSNDAGGQSKELLALRVEKLTLECESLRRELQVAGERVSLTDLAPWVCGLLESVKFSLPSQYRSELVGQLLRLPGVTADPVDVLRVCTVWGDGVLSTVISWCATHGLTVQLAGRPHPVDLAPILRSAFSERRTLPTAGAVPMAIDRTDVVRMFAEYVEALRSAGVEEEQLQRAGSLVTTDGIATTTPRRRGHL